MAECSKEAGSSGAEPMEEEEEEEEGEVEEEEFLPGHQNLQDYSKVYSLYSSWMSIIT